MMNCFNFMAKFVMICVHLYEKANNMKGKVSLWSFASVFSQVRSYCCKIMPRQSEVVFCVAFVKRRYILMDISASRVILEP